ncbi:MAG: ATP-binding protein [Ruminococcus sp.]|jgi:nitrogen fixation/metabolism regulation signal transduction histidine kinase|nr:ATP-binding protein [Ruminococcus sp.]
MNEIALNILDVAENSVSADSSLIEIDVEADSEADTLTVKIVDNGRGMSAETVKNVTDPFYTTRTTRRVGMGTSLFKMAAEQTGGSFEIISKVGEGTSVTAVFKLSSIDRMPLGDITETVRTLVTMNAGIDWIYRFKNDSADFTLDTREMKEVLDGVPLSDPDVSMYIKEMLTENHAEANADKL